ncbi:MAG TPA: DUF3488 and transglutaminase-like domain-containing protein [Frankiaceae bacterium]|nr:DUF3488 and transglutaminase-like domain-containing protein [Frankiaceae bacterium]
MTNRRSLMMPAAAGAVFLTMFSLMQVFEEQRWFTPSLFAIALAFGTGWAARRLAVPAALAPALSLLVMLTLLGLVFAPGTTALGFPTAATMQAIGDMLGAAVADIKEMAPPARPTDALTMLATAGVFLVATLVDLLVFWLRRPVAAGMPLLALFLIPTSMTTDANVFAFVLAATGYLGVLMAEGRDRARAWGRRLSGVEHADEFADVSHVSRVGRRIGSAAVGIALAVPIALPNVGDGIFKGTGGGVFGRGKGDQTAYVMNPLVTIRTQVRDGKTTELFVVETTSPQYLRLTSLDEFNGAEWTIVYRETSTDNRVGSDDDERIPTPRELDDVELVPVDYTVAIGDGLDVNWLPLAYAPRSVDVKGDWRFEDVNLSVFATERTSRKTTYRAQSLVPQPTVEQLREPGRVPDEIRRDYLRLPDAPPPASALEVLRTQTEGKLTPYDKAVALNSYFFSTGNFSYSLAVPPGNDAATLDQFLQRRSGYCEQFAAAMAYLARLANIPARVVVGFTPGTLRDDGKFVVTNKDAHAWPELWFPGTGWVRFEPTPRGGLEPPAYATLPAVPGEDPGSDDDPATPGPTAAPTATPGPGARGREAAIDDPAETGTTPDEPGAGSGGGGVPVAPIAGVGAMGMLATPALVAWATRRRRRSRATEPIDRIHAAWDSLADAAEDVGYPMRAADSPRGAARRLVTAASLSGSVAAEVERLATAEERARYARSAPPVDGLDASARLVRRTLLAGLPRVARARALVFPASSLRRITAFGRLTSEVVERQRDAVRAKAQELVRRRRPRAA